MLRLPALTFLALLAVPASAETTGKWKDYTEALRVMQADAVTERFDGTGTAVVHFERGNLYWDAVEKDPDAGQGQPVFGSCGEPTGADSLTGWEPTGDAGCAIEWVTCIAYWNGRSACRGRRPHGAQRAHATSTAKGLVAVAPGTRVISIALARDHAGAFELAVDWLLTPSDNSAWYAANGFSPQEADYYRDHFGGKSPADFWNVVATSGSFLHAGLNDGNSRSPGATGAVSAQFSEPCEVTNPSADPAAAAPHKYVDDWLRSHRGLPAAGWEINYQGYIDGIAKLRAAGIAPVFGAGNLLWLGDADGDGKAADKFKTLNGIGFPSCIEGAVAVSGVVPDYTAKTNRWKYIGSNSHPTMTDFVAPESATSHAAPLVAGAIAVLKSDNLVPDAGIDEILNYLGESSLEPALAGFSCDPAYPTVRFPDFDPWDEHASLDCGPVSTPYVAPYSLGVLDLQAAVNRAVSPEN